MTSGLADAAELSEAIRREVYELTAIDKDNKKLVYRGTLKGTKLTLDAIDPATKDSHRLEMYSVGEGLRFIVTGIAAVALVLAVILAGIIPLALRFARGVRSQGLLLPSASVLVGGFLLRMAIVLGPQSVH